MPQRRGVAHQINLAGKDAADPGRMTSDRAAFFAFFFGTEKRIVSMQWTNRAQARGRAFGVKSYTARLSPARASNSSETPFEMWDVCIATTRTPSCQSPSHSISTVGDQGQ
jgi:hypothetical protein